MCSRVEACGPPAAEDRNTPLRAAIPVLHRLRSESRVFRVNVEPRQAAWGSYSHFGVPAGRTRQSGIASARNRETNSRVAARNIASVVLSSAGCGTNKTCCLTVRLTSFRSRSLRGQTEHCEVRPCAGGGSGPAAIAEPSFIIFPRFRWSAPAWDLSRRRVASFIRVCVPLPKGGAGHRSRGNYFNNRTVDVEFPR